VAALPRARERRAHRPPVVRVRHRRTRPSASRRSMSWVMLERTQALRSASWLSGSASPAWTRCRSTITFASDIRRPRAPPRAAPRPRARPPSGAGKAAAPAVVAPAPAPRPRSCPML
jgi:hypothetical protein